MALIGGIIVDIPEHYKIAEELVKDSIAGLTDILGRDGEDITYYTPEALDGCIESLILAKANMKASDFIQAKKSKIADEQRQKDFQTIIKVINDYYGLSQSRLILKVILLEKIEKAFLEE